MLRRVYVFIRLGVCVRLFEFTFCSSSRSVRVHVLFEFAFALVRARMRLRAITRERVNQLQEWRYTSVAEYTTQPRATNVHSNVV